MSKQEEDEKLEFKFIFSKIQNILYIFFIIPRRTEPKRSFNQITGWLWLVFPEIKSCH
jgi:hypothetical protein